MIKRLPILRHYLREKYFRNFRNRAHFETWQQQRLLQVLSRASRAFPFYANMMDCAYEKFPLTNKQILLDHFAEMNSQKISLARASTVAIQAENTRDFSPKIGDVAVGLSTGTTGSRSIFLVSKQERNRWAGTLLAKSLPGSLLKKWRIAFIFRPSKRMKRAFVY